MADELSDIQVPDLWKQRFLIDWMLIQDVFPSEESFAGSSWSDWIGRIEEGQRAQEEQIALLAEELRCRPPDSSGVLLRQDDVLGDMCFQMLRTSDSMYAALVVAMWAEVENQLKNHVRASRCALKHVGEATGEEEKKRLDAEPYDKKRISGWLRQFMRLDISTLPRHGEIDVVRILNNSFKHSEGRYEPDEGNPWTKIDSTVLATLTCIGTGGEIDYSKVPFKRLIAACHDFCSALNRELITALEALQSADSGKGCEDA